MKCTVIYNSQGRIRVHAEKYRMSMAEADILEYYLRAVKGVKSVKVYDRTCDAVILYDCPREEIIDALARFSFEDENAIALVPDRTGRALSREYSDKLMGTIAWHFTKKLFMPAPIRMGFTVFNAMRYVKRGIAVLLKGKIEVSVLDATAITVSVLRGNYDTASSVMFMLRIGDILEEWTHKKSVDDLADAMSLNIEKVWIRREGNEQLVKIDEVEIGEEIIVRTGGMIPLDGKVTEGVASVNQSSMTGESMPVSKETGSYVYAGTVIDEGELVICVEKGMGSGRYDRIVRMIEESEKLKSQTENKYSHLADKLVPYSLGSTLLVYLLTRNAMKAMAVLMVDFSCALKLSMPVTVLSAIRESSAGDITVKGGKFLEAIAESDAIVFDKTGTLTHACPKVAEIVTFGGGDENEALRLAACLEEHYPHSNANAVVEEAARRGLSHEEHHAKVNYVVAHGIASTIDDKQALIGSYHFIFEDEGCTVPAGEEEKLAALSEEYSHLYLAVGGELTAVICINDPLREEASDVVDALHELGIKNVVMMTGDNKKTAAAVAKKVGVDDFYAEVLPEDKANYIKKCREKGHKVIMVGDGVNDSPALSEADCGIAISDGAAIAREIADVTVAADDLYALVKLKKISDAMMDRIHKNYRFIMTFNTGLIVLGVAGLLPAATSATLHNLSTLGIGLYDMTDLIKEED